MKAYLHTWIQLIKAPRKFFSAGRDLPCTPSPVAFLAVSSIISALSAMLLGHQSPNLIRGAILALNGFGMATLAAVFAYGAAVPVVGAGIPFGRLFGIFAHSSGVTLLFSWNPALVLFTEPWRWWLVWTGMRQTCETSRAQTAIVLIASFAMVAMLFWMLLPLTVPVQARGVQ